MAARRAGYDQGMVLLARIIRLATAAAVVVIVAGIVLHLLDANAGNTIVSAVYDAAGWLASPFDNVFNPSNPKVHIAVNWGLAALVYAIVGAVIAWLLVRAGLTGRTWWTRRRTTTPA
jgi:hypothetical protein